MNEVFRYEAIPGMRYFYEEEEDMLYYYTDEMLQKGVFICVRAAVENLNAVTDKIEFLTTIEVYFHKQVEDITLDAKYYEVYCDSILSDIQIYRILEDINRLFSTLPTNKFEKVVKDFSITFQSASMQSDLNASESVLDWIKEKYFRILSTEEKQE